MAWLVLPISSARKSFRAAPRLVKLAVDIVNSIDLLEKLRVSFETPSPSEQECEAETDDKDQHKDAVMAIDCLRDLGINDVKDLLRSNAPGVVPVSPYG